MKMRNEEGSVLVVALVMLVLLTLFGVMATNLAQTEIQISNNHYRHTQAFYHAEAGANLAMAVAKDRVKALKSTNNWGSWTDPDTFVNTTYSVPDSLMQFSVSITPKRDVDGHIVLWGDTNNNGTCEENLTIGYPILKIRSTGMAPGGARAVVEVLARINVIFGKVPAPLYGESGINTGPSSTPNSVRACSDEMDGSQCTEVVADAADCPDIDITNIKDVVSPVEPPTVDEIAAGEFDLTADHVCTKKVCGNYPAPGTGPSFPINQTIDNFKPFATFLSSPLKVGDDTTVDLKSGADLGTATDPGIFYCDKNLEISVPHIYGVLIVEGNLLFTGQTIVHGLVLVKGTSEVKGTGNLGIYGAFLGNGVVKLDGGTGFQYDCVALQSLKGKYEQYRMLAWMTD